MHERHEEFRREEEHHGWEHEHDRGWHGGPPGHEPGGPHGWHGGPRRGTSRAVRTAAGTRRAVLRRTAAAGTAAVLRQNGGGWHGGGAPHPGGGGGPHPGGGGHGNNFHR